MKNQRNLKGFLSCEITKKERESIDAKKELNELEQLTREAEIKIKKTNDVFNCRNDTYFDDEAEVSEDDDSDDEIPEEPYNENATAEDLAFLARDNEVEFESDNEIKSVDQRIKQLKRVINRSKKEIEGYEESIMHEKDLMETAEKELSNILLKNTNSIIVEEPNLITDNTDLLQLEAELAELIKQEVELVYIFIIIFLYYYFFLKKNI